MEKDVVQKAPQKTDVRSESLNSSQSASFYWGTEQLWDQLLRTE